MLRRPLPRRSIITGAARLAGGAAATAAFGRLALGQTGPAPITRDARRPGVPFGVQSGDVTGDSAIVWSKTDRPARMRLEWSLDEKFANAQRVRGPAALVESDFTARIDLAGLPAGEDIHSRVVFEDLADPATESAPAIGRFRTPPAMRQDVRFAFSGDECGQGWGINPDFGGMKLYESMRRMRPDFFIHSGDQIYADGPIKAEVKLDDGSIWKNLTTPAKSKVAETLDEFRGAFAYNLLDANKRRFCAEVPMLVQWDDHETKNNWFPGQMAGEDKRYKVASSSLLAAYAHRAMFEYNAMRIDSRDVERVYRKVARGPSLDVFMLDERSYRGQNSPNRQTAMNADSAFLGAQQLAWLKRSLLNSRATWKVIASDMPISIVVPDLNPYVVKGTYEAWANNEHGAPSGRELELANLLQFIKNNDIKNVVWVTADVHYASATYYDPGKAAFSEFNPFWEFVAGPINAGTFGPGEIDKTFGPEVRFMSLPAGMKQNRSPKDGLQYFGFGKIDGKTETLTMSLHDIDGKELFKVDLAPAA
ncbi:MAG: alkaline phosphatase D family protein [Rhodospirillaceae bacterium]|nr:alkaline phosphatase D family protein [Rhodospirillaceae bacterium]